MRMILKSTIGTLIALSFIGCASKDEHSNAYAKNQLEKMKVTSKHRLSK